MKVAIAALSAPAQLNGVSRHAANLARALLCQEEISSVHFLAGDWQKSMFPELIDRSGERLHMHWVSDCHGNLDRLAWYFWELPRLLKQLDAEVVHLAYSAPLRAAAIRCPIVVTLHDLYPYDIPGNFGRMRSIVSRQLMRQCLGKANAVACVSVSTQLQFYHWFGIENARRTVVIPNAVEGKETSSRGPLDQLNNGAPFVLCVSQHRQNKNVPLTIRIFANALRKGVLSSETLLLIVGIRGPATPQIMKEIRQSEAGRNVHLVSGISEPELQWCYRHCQFLLAPSRIEGFGLPIAEALLAGCPVVCSDIPAFREIGRDLVRYVPLNHSEVENYEIAICETLVGARPNAVELPHLSPRVIGAEYVSLYRRLTDHDLPVTAGQLSPSPLDQPIGN